MASNLRVAIYFLLIFFDRLQMIRDHFVVVLNSKNTRC